MRAMKHAFYAALLSLAMGASCAPKQAAVPPPQPSDEEFRLRVKIENVVMLTDFKGPAIPIGVDPRFALTLIVESVEPPREILKSGEVVTFAIHSPSLLFYGEVPTGKTCDFSLLRTTENGKTRLHGLRLLIRTNAGSEERACD